MTCTGRSLQEPLAKGEAGMQVQEILDLLVGGASQALLSVPESPGPSWREHAHPEGSRLFRRRHLPRHGPASCLTRQKGEGIYAVSMQTQNEQQPVICKAPGRGLYRIQGEGGMSHTTASLLEADQRLPSVCLSTQLGLQPKDGVQLVY